jgi:translation initiation factor SUI1
VQGISPDYDQKKLVKAFKKEFACNGCVVEHPEYGEVIQLQGDQRNNVCQFLAAIGLCREDQVSFYHAISVKFNYYFYLFYFWLHLSFVIAFPFAS